MPERIAVIWSPEARADLRGIERETAIQIYIDSFLPGPLSIHPPGGCQKIKPPLTGFRLRCGDYRLFFNFTADNTVEITGVYDRKDAYR